MIYARLFYKFSTRNRHSKFHYCLPEQIHMTRWRDVQVYHLGYRLYDDGVHFRTMYFDVVKLFADLDACSDTSLIAVENYISSDPVDIPSAVLLGFSAWCSCHFKEYCALCDLFQNFKYSDFYEIS